jgi:predicted RNA binding protein YcfA (HicA-like mRNA interferase family)
VAELPVVSGSEAIAAFAYFGYKPVRQKGSHVRLKCPGRPSITVPLHPTLKRGLLKGLIRDAGLSVGQFREGLDAS